jgi:hypothetical protein
MGGGVGRRGGMPSRARNSLFSSSSRLHLDSSEVRCSALRARKARWMSRARC